MISLEELENQCLPISKLKKYATEWGTKIQTTLFNKDVHAWNKSFQLNQSYYIINGKLNGAKPNFLSVHKDLELAFMNNTEVVEDKSQFKTEQFSNGFNSFDEAEKIINGSLFDVVCILLKVQALTREGRSVRREVIVTNESITELLTPAKIGDFVLSKTPISSLLINPQFEKANNLQEWNDNMKAQKIDQSFFFLDIYFHASV
ncbi:hypothetical protein H5410_058993 [Solanum commersonii]|uniref:Uncharacterized protein n=1 Tax=Solanum commersonii TaxID=4109 RepID=A0A9J5W158_SOLCO|nr:hypothetical protein H5410_058993 [Solanum commersonii]